MSTRSQDRHCRLKLPTVLALRGGRAVAVTAGKTFSPSPARGPPASPTGGLGALSPCRSPCWDPLGARLGCHKLPLPCQGQGPPGHSCFWGSPRRGESWWESVGCCLQRCVPLSRRPAFWEQHLRALGSFTSIGAPTTGSRQGRGSRNCSAWAPGSPTTTERAGGVCSLRGREQEQATRSCHSGPC